MTYQIKLDGYKSFENLGLEVLKDTLSRPIARQVYQTIKGKDGAYKMTKVVHGRVTREQRTLTITLQSHAQTHEEYEELCQTLDNLFDGETISIIRDSDPNFYLTGEPSFGSEPNFFIQTHTLTVLCEPYRMELEETIETFDVTTSEEITLTNSKMPVQPVFTTESSGMSVVFGNAEYSITTDGFTTPEIYLLEGETALTLKGTGTVTISYRKGVL